MNKKDLNIQFAICISGQEYGDLEYWKLYRILPDKKASEVELAILTLMRYALN